MKPFFLEVPGHRDLGMGEKLSDPSALGLLEVMCGLSQSGPKIS